MAPQRSLLRGDVYRVALDPAIGHEIQKTRPAIIVTANLYNRANWVVLVMPVTSHPVAEADEVLIEPPEGGLTAVSVALPDQLRAVDRSRLLRRLGRLNASTMAKVDKALKAVLALP